MTLFFFILMIASNGFGQTANDLLKQGVSLIDDDKIDEAIESLNRSIALDPSSSKAYCNLGFCYMQKQSHAKAFDYLEKAIELDPKDVLPHFHIGTCNIELDKYEEALPQFSKCIDLNPNFEVSYLYAGICLLSLNQDDEALRMLDKGLTVINNRQSSYKGGFFLYRGLVELQTGRIEAAEKDLKSSIQMNGGPLALLLLASIADIRGDHSASISYNTLIASMDSTLATSSYKTKTNTGTVSFKIGRVNQSNNLSYIGAAYHRLGLVDKSLNCFDRAVQIVGRNSQALNERGYLNLHRGELDASIADLNKSIEICPKKAKNYLYKAAAQFSIDPTESPILAKKVVELRSWKDPDSMIATIIGSLGALKAGDKKKSMSLLDEAIKHSKKNVWPYPLLKYLRGEFDENLLNKSARTPDQKSDAQAVIGLIAVARGRKDKASEHFHWLLKQGNPRSLYFDIAMNELRKIEGSKSVDDAVAQYCSKLYKSYLNTKK